MNPDLENGGVALSRQLAMLSSKLLESRERFPRISHQLFCWQDSPGQPPNHGVWASLIGNPKAKLPRRSAEIMLDKFPDGTTCSRYYGSGEKVSLKEGLTAFLNLAREGQHVLQVCRKLSLPDDCFKFHLPTDSRQPGSPLGGHYEWLELMSRQSLANHEFPAKKEDLSLAAKGGAPRSGL